MGNIDTLRQRLGMHDARVVREGLVATIGFFDAFVHDDPLKWWEHLRGIDFHQRIEIRILSRGTPLVRDDSIVDRAPKPFSYFTNPRVSPFRARGSFAVWDYRAFSVARDTPALVSCASGLRRDRRTRGSIDIGATQFIIALADLPNLVRVPDAEIV